jgi:glycosyltransferase involved in cell wall biosynthesis
MVSPAAPWPATTGGLVRIAAILEQLSRHCDVTFVAPRRADQRPPAALPARLVCPELPDAGLARKALAALDPTRPFHVAMYYRKEIDRLVHHELAQHPYDLVYSHFLYGLSYLNGSRTPVAVDTQNVDRVYFQNKADHSAFPFSAFAAWNARRTIAYETQRLSSIWAYVSVSEEDRALTRAYADHAVRHFWVAANGVDTRRFRPSAPRDPGTVVTLGYLGSMSLQMNIEAVQRFCRDMLPRIRASVAGLDVRFTVIGREPSAAIRNLARDTPGMTLSGTVDDVLPWLQKIDILVCPLRMGAGTKLKVAEALACGIPVVGTPLAFAGLAGASGVHYVQADDGAFVEAVCRLARDPAERAAMGAAARAFAERHLEWDTIGDGLAADIRSALDARHPE